jgi:citrate synthase
MEKLVPGLEGVPIMESQVGFIDGQKGILEYRGIPIEELAEKSTYEEVSYLLLWGKLPTRGEMAKFDHDLRTHRRVKYRIIDLMKCLPENGHPMDALQAAVSVLGMFYPAKIDAAGFAPGTDVLDLSTLLVDRSSHCQASHSRRGIRAYAARRRTGAAAGRPVARRQFLMDVDRGGAGSA